MPKYYTCEMGKHNLGSLTSKERPEIFFFSLIVKNIIKQDDIKASPFILKPWAQTAV